MPKVEMTFKRALEAIRESIVRGTGDPLPMLEQLIEQVEPFEAKVTRLHNVADEARSLVEMVQVFCKLPEWQSGVADAMSMNYATEALRAALSAIEQKQENEQ